MLSLKGSVRTRQEELSACVTINGQSLTGRVVLKEDVDRLIAEHTATGRENLGAAVLMPSPVIQGSVVLGGVKVVEEAPVSADRLNRLTRKADGLYVSDDLNPDPLAYYILSKN